MNILSSNTIIYCKHWEQSVLFYRSIMGLRQLSSHSWFVEFELTRESRLSIADEARCSLSSSSGNGLTISLKVENVDQVHGILMDRGGMPQPIREQWGSRAFFIYDPEGTRIEYWS